MLVASAGFDSPGQHMAEPRGRTFVLMLSEDEAMALAAALGIQVRQTVDHLAQPGAVPNPSVRKFVEQRVTLQEQVLRQMDELGVRDLMKETADAAVRRLPG